jgi:BlaI family transcriptional regulator, penicillinase repressor
MLWLTIEETMENLTPKEEEIMQIIWSLDKCFVKDIIGQMEESRPAYTTISSIVRILEGKGFVGHTAYGNTYQYHPIVAKEDYRKNTFRSFVQNYFDNSFRNVVSFLVEEKKLSKEEIEDLANILKEIKNEKKGGSDEQ